MPDHRLKIEDEIRCACGSLWPRTRKGAIRAGHHLRECARAVDAFAGWDLGVGFTTLDAAVCWSISRSAALKRLHAARQLGTVVARRAPLHPPKRLPWRYVWHRPGGELPLATPPPTRRIRVDEA